MLHCTMLYYTIPYHTIVYFIILYQTILYYSIDYTLVATFWRTTGHDVNSLEVVVFGSLKLTIFVRVNHILGTFPAHQNITVMNLRLGRVEILASAVVFATRDPLWVASVPAVMHLAVVFAGQITLRLRLVLTVAAAVSQAPHSPSTRSQGCFGLAGKGSLCRLRALSRIGEKHTDYLLQ